MSDFIHHTRCPVCGSDAFNDIITVKDYTVSGELFPIAECRSCSLRFTQDIPEPDKSIKYYKSENYISHSNTSKGLINELYQKVRNRTMLKKRRMIEKLSGLQMGSLLDVGSGIGTFVSTMKEHGWDVTGIEPDESAREKAKEVYALELLDEESINDLPLNTFDVITLWHVLEHIYYLDDYLEKLRSLLKDNGKIFIAVPNYTSHDARVYNECWAAYDVPRHLYHFSPRSMQVLMDKKNLKIVACKPMWYDSFYISLLSSKYKNGKTRWIAALWTGFRSNFSALFDTKKCSSVVYVVGK